MPEEYTIPVRAIWLRREGDHAVVLIEQEKGKWIEVVREHIDGPFSHIVERHGMANRLRQGEVRR